MGATRAGGGSGSSLPPSREIDGAVLRRAQRGDHGAFHEIVDHYEGRLRVLAYHLLRDADLMNDALQDTFVKAWGGLPEFRGEAALGTWLHQVCYRICLDYLRRQKVRPAGEELADDLADPTDDVGGLALRDQVSAALGRLPGRAARRPPARRPRGLRLRHGRRGARGPGRDRGVAPLARSRGHAPCAPTRDAGRGGAAMTAPTTTSATRVLSALLRANVDAPPLRPGFHDELEARLQSATAAGAAVTTVPARRRRVRPLRLLAAASVAAAAAIFAFAVLPALRGGDTATAGDVLAAMTAASGGAQTVRLHMVSTIAVTGQGPMRRRTAPPTRRISP